MEEKNFNRRQMLGGVAAAAGTAALSAAGPVQAAEPAAQEWPDMGAPQPPPIKDVKDKVAYITGGSSGIGLGIARALHEAGAKVILGNLDESQFADALKEFPAGDARVRTIVHDVLDREGWERKADEIGKLFGPVHILVNNAGVGRLPNVIQGTLKDWDWGMGVNFWGPLCGIRTFVPRMLAHGQGSHIVTTSSTDGVLFGSGNVYAVSKMAVSGLMEALRHELRATNIGTSNLCPGATTTNLAQSATYRPESLRNPDPPPAAAPQAPPTARQQPGAGARAGGPPRRAETTPLWARPQLPLTVGRLVVNGILNNDMWIFPAPEYRVGVEARGQAMAESMVAFTPMPENIVAGRNNYFRTPIYVQEIAHRRATQRRTIPGI
ncbi:MAG TPA: SDR family NAD(P)-dependent oxidoreductase [Steroidobacteraceae bacterium]|nr:SDR family NAD(P)-dependent oxidoreductase [Steroidobacteraceae bacterium]